MSPPTNVGGEAKDSEHEAKDPEIQQLKAILEANKKEIDMLKKRAWDANEQYTTECDYRMSLEDELEDALQDVYWMRPELARKTDRLQELSHDNKSKSEQLHKAKDQLEEQRIKNVELTKALNEKGAKLASVQQAMARLGRNDEQSIDDEIAQRFSNLKSDIMQFVRHLFSLRKDAAIVDEEEDAADEEGNDEELEELHVRRWVAEELYNRFFDLDALFKIFGASAEYGSCFEQLLREGGCAESLIKARRIAHAKACTATSDFGKNLDDMAEAESEAVWIRMQNYREWIRHGATSEDMVVEKAILAVFQNAARLAIYLHGLPVEYEWEQLTWARGSEVNKKDHDIIATWGPDPDKNDEFGLGCVVFGGVVRGDKATGLLANARVRLLKNQVVIAWALSEL